jgi:hypothetical protein
MLPGIRAIVATVLTAVGLLAASFALVAALRVAQDIRLTSLQADLHARSRLAFAAPDEPHTRLIVDPPASALPAPEPDAVTDNAPPAPELEVIAAPAIAEAQEVTAAPPPAPQPPEETAALETILAAPAAVTPATALPIGGPFEPVVEKESGKDKRKSAADRAAKRAAANKARAARLARARRDAARRTAQAHAVAASDPFASFNDTRSAPAPFNTLDRAGRATNGP